MWRCKKCGGEIIMQASFYHPRIDKDGQAFFYHPAIGKGGQAFFYHPEIDKDGNLESVYSEDESPTGYQCLDCSDQGDEVADIADWVDNPKGA